MNFLPLVIMFLLIFGAISASFISSLGADKSEAEAYQGRLVALRRAYNEVEDFQYEKRKDGPSEKKEGVPSSSQSKPEKTEEKTYFRILRTGSPHGAINLAKLIQNDADNDWLSKLAISYLKSVYGNARFIKELKNPNWAEDLLLFLVSKQKEAYKEKSTFLSLDKLCPENDLKKHYFRLILGTNSCDPVTGRGYLPLESCITFQKDEMPINIHFANPQLLILLFGEEATKQIEAKEWPEGRPREEVKGRSKYSLEKEDLKKLLGEAFEPIHERNISDTYRTRERYNQQAFDPKTFISAQVLENSKPE